MGRIRQAKPKPPLESEARPETTGNSPAAAAVLAGLVTALFVLRPLYPSESVAAEGDGLPVVMLWLLALTLWAILVARGSIVRVHFGWPDLAMSLLVLWHSVAALWAVAFESPRPACNMLWEWLGLAVAFFLSRQVFARSLQRRAIGAVMVALAVVVSLYGLYQYSIGLPATRAFYQHASEEELRQAGVWFPPGSPERQTYEQRLASLEPMATFALTNSLAGFLAPWAMVALGISAAFATRLDLRQRLGAVSLLVPIGLCLLLTKSRGAFLACALGVVVVAAIWWLGGRTQVRARRGLLAAVAVALLLAGAIFGAVSIGGLDAEVLSEAPKSLGYRIQYWRASASMIRDLPLLGCGPGNFQHRYTAYKLPEASEEITDPHNFFIEIWANAGTPAVLALVLFGVAFSLCVLRSARHTGDVSANTAARVDTGRQDASAIFCGALAGMLLSIPVGAMSVAPTAWFVPLAGIPVGALVLVMLRQWVACGDDSPILWTVAAGVLLVHLLFAGGISYPGVAAGLWLLAALALNASHCGQRSAGPRVGAVVVACGLVLITACYLTGYQPTVVARTQILRVFAGADDPRTLLSKAAAADRWAIEPRKLLAGMASQQWLAQPNAESWRDFEQAVHDTLARAPRAASLRHEFGLAYCECYGVAPSQERLATGIRLLEAAVALYPNNCRMRADLAEAYLLKPDAVGYERERAEALRLDVATPHMDKKLPGEQRLRLSRNRLAPSVRPAMPQ